MSGNRQIVCPGCGATNRVPTDKPAGVGKCGKCGNALFNGKPLDADAGMFSRQTGRSDIPVLVMLGALVRSLGRWRLSFELRRPSSRARDGSNSIPEVERRARRPSYKGPDHAALFGRQRIGRISGAMNTQQIVGWARDQLSKNSAAQKVT